MGEAGKESCDLKLARETSDREDTEEGPGLALNLLCRDKEPKESKSCDSLVQLHCHLFT